MNPFRDIDPLSKQDKEDWSHVFTLCVPAYIVLALVLVYSLVQWYASLTS